MFLLTLCDKAVICIYRGLQTAKPAHCKGRNQKERAMDNLTFADWIRFQETPALARWYRAWEQGRITAAEFVARLHR